MLDGKRMIVTGGTRGIGAAIARRAAHAGADIAVVGRDRISGETVTAAVEAAGRKATFVEADFANPASAGKAVTTAADALGGLDVLVNNAAIALRRNLETASVDDWHRMLDVNLLAPFFAAQAAAGRFGKDGVIINIASEMGRLANPASILYGVTKAALLHLNSNLALTLADRGVRVVAVAPGPVRTEMLEASARQSAGGLEAGLAGYAARIPLKRLAGPDEVAETVVFAASAKAGFMTGSVIALDGGSTIPSG